MTRKQTLLALSAALLGTPLLAPAPVRADDAADAEALRAEVKKLREEVEALKGRADEAEVKAKDAVVAGDIPGSFRIPGTEISLRLYGFAELNWVHDFRGDNAEVDYATFAPYLPPEGTDDAGRKNRDYFTARTSRIGLEMGTPTRWGVLAARIEGDFNNEPRLGGTAVYVNGDGGGRAVITQQATNSYGFRIRHAYGSFAGLLVGMTWSTFMDADWLPETVDFNGPIGATFIRQPVIRYTYGTPDWGSFTLALENSSSYVINDQGSVVPGSISRIPDVVARWDKGFSWGALGLRAVTQELRVDGNIEEPGSLPQPAPPAPPLVPRTGKATRRGYGAAGTAVLRLRGNQDTASLQVTFGDGIGRYLNYIEGAFYDASANVIRIERAVGLVAGYQVKATDWLRVNLVYGMTRSFDNEYTDEIINAGLHTSANMGRYAVNRMVQQVHVGPIFTPVKGVDLGVEGIWGQRETLAGEKGDSIRFNFSAKYYLN